MGSQTDGILITLGSTGAGDCFIAGLTAFFDEGVEWACSVGSAASSAIVETHGPIISCDKTEIMRRAEQIQDRIQRLD